MYFSVFFSHPDFTVGVGFAPTPPLLFQAPGHGLTNFHLLTAGKEFHLAPKNIKLLFVLLIVSHCRTNDKFNYLMDYFGGK